MTSIAASSTALTGHTGFVWAATFSPDSRYLVTGSSDFTARLWDITSGKTVQTFDGQGSVVLVVAFAPDGQHLVTGHWDGTTRLWDVASGAEVGRFLGHTRQVYSAAFSPDGCVLMTGSKDRTIRLWDVATQQPIRTLEGHKSLVVAGQFSADGRQLLSVSWDSIRLWDVESGAEQKGIEMKNGATVAAISPDLQRVWAMGWDHQAAVWDVASGEAIVPFADLPENTLCATYAPDGQTILTGGEDFLAMRWEANTGRLIHRRGGHTGWIAAVAFSPDSRWMATASWDKTARVSLNNL
ncbi:MAG: hypothetical protein BroJett018_25830 [Chloroflexota bacterium]|nr:MAG: hypothetical protein BroJett018_25830 [Chloroflexota bacterium]